jgi:thymidylate synthase
VETLALITGYHDYWWLPAWVREHGVARSPRGRLTYDAGPVTLVTQPAVALPLNCGRGVNPRIAAVEALQLIGAFTDVELTVWASPHFKQFVEDEDECYPRHFHGAYGMRIGSQLEDVYAKLTADPFTRQAVITLWDPQLDYHTHKRDYPCTVAIGFRLLDVKGSSRRQLEMNVLMRSSDVWLGIPYDLFQFGQLQLTLATLLNAQVGAYRHTTWSLHLYEEHVERITQLYRPTEPSIQPSGLAQPGDTVEAVMGRAWRICHEPDSSLPELGASAQWFRGYMAPWAREDER